MKNYCQVCKQQNKVEVCPNCGFKKIDGEASLDDLCHNQVLLMQKLSEVQQQLKKPMVQEGSKVLNVLAGIVKPLKIKLKEIALHESVNRVSSFFQDYLKKDNTSITNKLTETSALRLVGQKKVLESVPFLKLDGALTNLSIQQLMERQTALFHELVEEEQDEIRKALEQQMEKIQQHKRTHSKDFKA